MKIKLETFIAVFPGIKAVYDVMPEFARMQELADSYSEAKKCNALYEERKEKLMPIPDKDGNVLTKDFYAAEKELAKMLKEEIELKRPPQFTEEECEVAAKNRTLLGSVYEAMRPYFIAKASPKETEDKK